MPKAQLMISKAEEDATTLFVGNLGEQVTEELLYELFLQVGPLASVKIPKDKNRKCNFGFIRFKHQCSPDYAINLLQGTSLFNRNINLQRRNKSSSNNQRQRTPQEQNRHTNYNDDYDMGKQKELPELRHIRFDSQPNFEELLEMSANLVNAPNFSGNNRDYWGNNDNNRFNDRHRSFEDSRGYNDSLRDSRSSGNRDKSYQGGHDNRRHNSNDLASRDNDRGYDDRRGHSGGKSHKQSRNHDRRPYETNNRRGRY